MSDISPPMHKFLEYHYVVSLYLNLFAGQFFKFHCLGHPPHNIIQRWFINYLQIFKIMSQNLQNT